MMSLLNSSPVIEAITRLIASFRGSLYCELRSALNSAFSPLARAPCILGAPLLAILKAERPCERDV